MAEQWPHPTAKEWTPQLMKNDLSKRALTLSQKFVHPYQGDEPFIYELCRVGLIELFVNGERVVPREASQH